MYIVHPILRLGGDVPHFPVALLLAINLGLLSEATSMGMVSIVSRGDLLRKLNFKHIIVLFKISEQLITILTWEWS